MLVAFAFERGLELALNRRNSRWLRAHGAVWYGERDGFLGILATQVLLFTLVPIEVAVAAWSGVWWGTWPALAGLVAAQVLRYWCITTLGRRWSIRVVTLPDTPRIVRGPYRWLPHPNYLVVFAEVVLLPVAFGSWATLLVVAPLKLLALRRRIHIEERALARAAPSA